MYSVLARGNTTHFQTAVETAVAAFWVGRSDGERGWGWGYNLLTVKKHKSIPTF